MFIKYGRRGLLVGGSRLVFLFLVCVLCACGGLHNSAGSSMEVPLEQKSEQESSEQDVSEQDIAEEVPSEQEPLEKDAAEQVTLELSIPAHEETAERVYGTEGKITYSLYLKGVEPNLAAYIAKSMKNAVAHYNANGDFKKHVVANYHVGVATAQANWDGKITFGTQRNTRTAIHEISHTLGVGTHAAFWKLMTDGTWDGPRANAVLSEFDGPGSVLTGKPGDGHILKYGANHDGPENNPTHLYRHVKIVEAMRCDMGIGRCYDYEGDNIKIVNRASGLVLDFAENRNGGNVLVNTDSASPNQKWHVANVGLGDISFRNSQGNQRALDTWGGGQVDGTNIALYGFWGGDSQRYRVEQVEPGWFAIKPKVALDQCIDAQGVVAGDNVGTWSCHGGHEQQWGFDNYPEH